MFNDAIVWRDWCARGIGDVVESCVLLTCAAHARPRAPPYP